MASLSPYLAFYGSALSSTFNIFFGRLFTPQNPPPRDLTGQTAIVTGANSGIGLYIALQLAQQGATVYLACRNQEKGEAAVSFIKSQLASSTGEASTNNNVFCWTVDVSSLDSVRAFCDRWIAQGTPIDMLVHNAGIPDVTGGQRRLDDKGRDVMYVTNVLGSFLMTHLLEQRLSSDARIVFTSSGANYGAADTVLLPRPPRLEDTRRSLLVRLWHAGRRYLGLKESAAAVYAQTKAHQVLLAALLQQHFSSSSATTGNKRTAHAFGPGFTRSSIFGKFDLTWRTWLSDPGYVILRYTEMYIATDTNEGAKTGTWLAAWGGSEQVPGGAYWECMTKRVSGLDFVRAKMGEERFREAARNVWREWEMDAGCRWDIKI
jgi:NAD(P)-dependent dehydrogenase (short-subunit alcohol dehydrogenase family)